MSKLLRYIKNKAPWLWRLVENLNSIFVLLFFKKKLDTIVREVEQAKLFNDSTCRRLSINDGQILVKFLDNLNESDLVYFKPFSFTKKSIYRILSSASYLMFGVFIDNVMMAVFFLRVFGNNKAYLGFVVSSKHRGKGVGKKIIATLIESCKTASMQLFSTVSITNSASWRAHLGNGFVPFKTLKNGIYELEAVIK